MRSFAELLSEYMARTGISDAELARSIGVRRQTVFRWKEGVVSRPRHREDVLRCAHRLRLTPEELDALLVAAGFPPEGATAVPAIALPTQPAPISPTQVVETVITHVGRPRRSMSPLAWAIAVATLVVLGGISFLATRLLIRGTTTYPVAAEGETLIVVGQFVNYMGGPSGYNVAGRIQAALEREIEAAQLNEVRVVVWPEEIRDEAAAEAVGQRAKATVVIWGEYDSGRALARFTLPGSRSEPDEPQLEKLVASPSDLSATVNSTLPAEVRYVALLTLGQLYADQGNINQSRAVLTQALAQPPAESDALATLYFRLGYIYQAGEPFNLDQAIHYYSHVIALQPEWAAAYNNRGIAYLDRGQAGDLDRAIEDLTQAIATRPDNAAAYNNRGAVYLERDGPDDLRRALEDLSQAIELAPNAPGAYLNRGLTYVRLGERERWLEDLKRALDLAPNQASAYNALCWAYALDQKPEFALPYCDQAVALDQTGYSHDSRGVVYAELGRLEEAARDFGIFLDWLQGQPEGVYQRHGPTREAWLQALKTGRNPIDAGTLEQLRLE